MSDPDPTTLDATTRPLGPSGIAVSTVALGCWPISGMTSLDVNEPDSLATIEAALEAGVTFFDTAFAYGGSGESERLVGRVLKPVRDRVVLATKGGLGWDPDGQRVLDARPETIQRQCDESLRRLGTDRVELYYLHAPDPETPIAESAGAFREILQAGKARAIGVSNLTVAQMETFAGICPISAVQPPYNLIHRTIERDVLPWCRQRGIALAIYWPLMKGLLAGKLARDHHFDDRDGRKKYVMFQGDEWQRNHDLLDDLRAIADEAGLTVAQLAVAWTLHQPGITTALCGAKRPGQIIETAHAMHVRFSGDQIARIDAALERRGQPRVRNAV